MVAAEPPLPQAEAAAELPLWQTVAEPLPRLELMAPRLQREVEVVEVALPLPLEAATPRMMAAWLALPGLEVPHSRRPGAGAAALRRPLLDRP